MSAIQRFNPVSSKVFRNCLTTGMAALLLVACSGSEEKALALGSEAQSLLEAHRIAEARQTINRAIEQRDDILDLQLLRARIEVAAGDQNSAYSAFNDALALDRSNPEALVAVAQIGLQNGHLNESEAAVDRLMTLYPGEPEALILKGVINVVHNRGEAALANAEAVLAQAPNSEPASLLKGRALFILRRPDEALAAVLDAKRIAPQSPAVAQALAEVYRQRNEGRKMLGELEILLAAQPDDQNIPLDIANTQYKLGETAPARMTLFALSMKQRTGAVTARLITDLWREYDLAPLTPEQITNLAAQSRIEMRIAAARFYLETGALDQAERVLAQSPASDDVNAVRASIAIARGQPGVGEQLANAILSHDKTHCGALLAKSEVQMLGRKFGDAVTNGQVAIANCPQLVSAYLVLAAAKDALPGAGRPAAELVYREAVQRNPQDFRVTFAYADWLERGKESTRAVAIARRLTNSAPALVSGWRYYLTLCKRYPAENCARDAALGVARSEQRYAVDLRPDQPPEIRLFGRLNDR